MLLGDGCGLGGQLCVDIEDGVRGVPDVEPFGAVAERLAGDTLEQEKG
jgi:hypothetical protein